jgi:hypothetical protein
MIVRSHPQGTRQPKAIEPVRVQGTSAVRIPYRRAWYLALSPQVGCGGTGLCNPVGMHVYTVQRAVR